MKRIVNIILSFVLILGLCIPAYAEETKTIDELLAPYQNAIDKVNGELGSNIYIPDKNKEKFYNNVKHMSPSEVENLLRNEYKDITSGKPFITQSEPNSYTKSYAMKNGQKKHDTSPMHVRQDIMQTAPISYNSQMFLNSTVFSATGASGTYIYETINSYGSSWPSDYTGYHFEVDSGSYSLSSNKKNCTVTLRGHPEDAYGSALTLSLTEKVTFSVD